MQRKVQSRVQSEQIDLEDEIRAATREGQRALKRTAAKHEIEIEALVPIARELAKKAGAGGVTVADVRLTATQRGLLPSSGDGRELSWLGAVMKRAGLVRSGRRRATGLMVTHGRENAVWLDPSVDQSAAA